MTDVNEQIPSYSFSFLHAFFFFLELSCVTSFFSFLFTPSFFFFFSFWGCAVLLFSVLDIFLFLSGGRRICSSCFWSLFLVSYFLGPCVFPLSLSLSLSLDRLNKPLRNRFLLVLNRFSDRLRGTMVTQSNTISWTICPSSGTKYVYVPYSQWTLCAKWTCNVH